MYSTYAKSLMDNGNGFIYLGRRMPDPRIGQIVADFPEVVGRRHEAQGKISAAGTHRFSHAASVGMLGPKLIFYHCSMSSEH